VIGETVTRDQIVSQRIGVSECARWDGTHALLNWKPFAVPPVFDEFTVTHWATCPTTGDPILLTCREELVPVERSLVAVFSTEDRDELRRQYDHEAPSVTALHIWKETPGGE
jgi:hypothetical protein